MACTGDPHPLGGVIAKQRRRSKAKLAAETDSPQMSYLVGSVTVSKGHLLMSQHRASPGRPREAEGLHEILLELVEQQGLATVLQGLAHVMAEIGSVTGGLVSEAYAIEAWLATQQQRPPASR